MPSLADTIRDFPPVTRFFTITTVLTGVLCSLDMLKVDSILLAPRFVVNSYNEFKYVVGTETKWVIFKSFLKNLVSCYRFFTTFLIPSGYFSDNKFSICLDAYFFHTFANHLENRRGKFKGNFPDCLWFTLLSGTFMVIPSLLYAIFMDSSYFPIYHSMMLSCLTYTWSRTSKDSMINFMGVVPIKAYYLPLFNLVYSALSGGFVGALDTMFGIFGGYLYQCVQSDTIPIYNLIPNAYPGFTVDNSGRKVGTSQSPASLIDHFHSDSIFDKGYLKAPKVLYKLLNYPVNTSKRVTAFQDYGVGKSYAYKNDDPVTPTATTSSHDFVFKGPGRRLGD